MSNGSLFLLAALIEVSIVFIASRLGREWLFGTVAVNLVLIGVFGAKLISVFGFFTNVGNVFYASVFLATHFIVEQQGKNAALPIIWFGAGSVLFFTLMSQVAVNYDGLPLSDAANNASTTLFSLSPRVVIGSVLAYTFAQYVNISVFSWLRTRTTGSLLWLRSNGANIISQLVDSLLFFSIAFFDLPGPALVQAILTGWFLKSMVVLGGTPFLYFDSYFQKKDHES